MLQHLTDLSITYKCAPINWPYTAMSKIDVSTGVNSSLSKKIHKQCRENTVEIAFVYESDIREFINANGWSK